VKRKRVAAQENHERWLVSYADFITLLFAFFVVMFASVQSDRSKAQEVSASVRDAMENSHLGSVLSTVLGKGRHENSRTAVDPRPDAKTSGAGLNVPQRDVGAPKGASQEVPPPTAAPQDLAKSAATLERAMAGELASGKVAIRLDRRGLAISLREAGFFASGDDTVSPSCLATLAKIAAVAHALPNPVRLEGFTDSVPIHNSRYRSNWELSAARAIATLEILAERYHVERSRMAVAGYAENAPTDSNETEQGRAHNRRVDIVLLTQDGLRSEPMSPAAQSDHGGGAPAPAKGK
jgi:chemotaxis protein MotB